MTTKLDIRPFWDISYGIYAITSIKDDNYNAKISNTVTQVTEYSPLLTISVNKRSLTHEYIEKSGVFGISILEKACPIDIIDLLGFKSGRDVDKLKNLNYEFGLGLCPLITDYSLSTIEAEVISNVNLDTHTLFIAKAVASKHLKDGEPMTFAQYTKLYNGNISERSPVPKLKYGDSIYIKHGNICKPAKN